ncbi:KipI family sensor histidine kinase inhibitor [Actinocorallia herbida]|uniref:KipI family sensor histidine kinase inhibitor n=1 Tax=Actinocorallia herbida TaxID=58109 RepID=A0A3N1D796_9ACTN|nr:5-oxoprolinase subunit PxpB [Actinocorallia herbida]ROO89407.1 KipI family sensor histidine kinase inhibitor [Actinocorallia herbida]
MDIRPAGDRALLVETDAPHALRAAVAAAGLPGVAEIVPGERTLLVVFTGPVGDAAGRIAALEVRAAEAGGRLVEVPVVYDGADLAEVSELTGLSVPEVVRRHAAAEYTVAYLGFSPGFGYLTGLDGSLTVPRKETPRTSVPAGSVAIAGPYTSVYPSASPGGWRLIGRTGLRLWDVDRDPPSLLEPGDRVRFRESVGGVT